MTLELDKIIIADVREYLSGLPDACCNCCVTSPPYFGLRSYLPDDHPDKAKEIGSEKTPDEYVQNMVEIFEQVKRVLRDDGTLWLNLGDSYNSATGQKKGKHGYKDGRKNRNKRKATGGIEGLKPKDLLGMPWAVAFALRSAGWWLRSDIIWVKPAVMPESVTDRCTKSHEHIFLLAKKQKYYFDADAIATDILDASIKRNQSGWNGNEKRDYPTGARNNLSKYFGSEKAKGQKKANKRDVWTVPTKAYSEAHYAAFPGELIRPCILAGCPEGGVVLDPFMGSGTVAHEARSTGRHFLGCDFDERNYILIKKRLGLFFDGYANDG